MSQPSRRRRLLRLAILLGLVGAVAGLFVAGAFEPLQDQERMEQALSDAGAWGPILYMLGFLALQPLSLPGALLIIPATLLWPAWQVFVFSWLGGLLASTVGFAIARWLGRDWVESRLPDRFRRWDDRLERRGLSATIALRVVTGYAPPADWVLGVSRVTVPQFLLGTAIGLAVPTAAMAVWGDDAVRAVERAPLLLVPIVGLGAAGWAAVQVRRRRRAADGVEQAAGTDFSADETAG